MLTLFDSKGEKISFKTLRFSGGELHPRIDGVVDGHVHILADLRSSDDVMELLLICSALEYLNCRGVCLRCPYLPYARQDRVAFPGEALGLRTMCDLINAMAFDVVEVWDAHSDVATALLNSVVNVHQKEFVKKIPQEVLANSILVAPDAGAIKKTIEIAKELKMRMARADKIRSTEDGSITGTKVYTDFVYDKDFLIVDDICDGGRTFIELAKELRGFTNGKIRLYVTHGIFSKGFDALLENIDHIYTPNPWPLFDEFSKFDPSRLTRLE